MKQFQPADFIRVVGLGRALRSSIVYTRDTIPESSGSIFSLFKSSNSVPFLRRAATGTIASRKLRPTAVVSARQLAGMLSWEIDVLQYISDGKEDAVEALAMLSDRVALAKGRAIFMRVASENVFIRDARRNGFFPSHHETVYERVSSATVSSLDETISMKLVTAEDAIALFRLYCSSVPSEIRTHQGMTFELWTSSAEPSKRTTKEWVSYRDGVARGWLRIFKRGMVGKLELMVHPDDELELTRPLLDFGLSRLPDRRNMYVLVPEHQILLARLVSQRGFKPRGDFLMLAKSLAVRERIEETARFTAVSR